MTVLCYHTVHPVWRSPLAVPPETFAAHCRWLAARRSVLDMPEAVARLDGRMRLPRGCTLLTFDDGFASLYDHAFPLLKQHRLPATVFLVAETLAPSGRVVDWIDPPPVEPPPTLTLEQILEMRSADVRFASHSFSHYDLTTLGEEECVRDLRTSRELLEDLLSSSVPYLAYPKGRQNRVVRRAAQRAGYTHAFSLPETTESTGPFSIPRAGVYPANGVAALRVKSARSYLPVRMSSVFPALRMVVRGRSHTLPSSSGELRSQPRRKG